MSGTTTFVNPKTGANITVRNGSSAYDRYISSGATPVSTTASTSTTTTPVAPYSAGSSAKNQASFNGSNWKDASGVWSSSTNDGQLKELNHGQASVLNPLHPVNGARQGLISDALKSGNWQNLWEFESKQNPAHYTKDANGNAVQNKEYWKPLIESSQRAYQEAIQSGNKEVADSWARTLSEQIEKMNSAPGLTPYIVGINSSPEYAQQYGVEQASSEWFNSPYNSQAYLQNMARGVGSFDTSGGHWSNNAYFQDNPQVLQGVLGQIGASGVDVKTLDPGTQLAMQNYLGSGVPQLPQMQIPSPISVPQMPAIDFSGLTDAISDLAKSNQYNNSANQQALLNYLGMNNQMQMYQTESPVTSVQQSTNDDALNRYLQNIWGGQ